MGSKRISFEGVNVSLTTYNRVEELGEDLVEAVERITGQGGVVFGVGRWSGVIRGSSRNIEDLRGMELGHGVVSVGGYGWSRGILNICVAGIFCFGMMYRLSSLSLWTGRLRLILGRLRWWQDRQAD